VCWADHVDSGALAMALFPRLQFNLNITCCYDIICQKPHWLLRISNLHKTVQLCMNTVSNAFYKSWFFFAGTCRQKVFDLLTCIDLCTHSKTKDTLQEKFTFRMAICLVRIPSATSQIKSLEQKG
jgi:hypothetical protein